MRMAPIIIAPPVTLEEILAWCEDEPHFYEAHIDGDRQEIKGLMFIDGMWETIFLSKF